jgi:hypothetical protein
VPNVYVDIASLAEKLETSINSVADVTPDRQTTDSDPTETVATQLVSIAGNI